jgi:membrane-associated phospholipid phosphatase
MPILILFILALSAGVSVYLLARHYPTAAGATPPATAAAGEQLAVEAVRHPWFARLLRGRLDPETATGLALTLALAITMIGAIAVGALAYLVRSSGHLIGLDASVGDWANRHAVPWSTQLLQLVTDLASTPATVLVLLVVIALEMIRVPNRWVPPFLLTVIVGEVLLVNTVKQLLDRVRPSFNPVAATLGPSFPSGHSATAAALYASVALVLARRRSPRVRALLAGGAAGIAVGVACSRVMLDVHWLSDVVAGLSFGWAWFAICAVAFGGRFLSFGAPLEKAEQVAESLPPTPEEAAAENGSDVVEVTLQRAKQPAVTVRDSR